MTRVVHMTSAHPAEDNRIFLKECVSLAAAGYDVVLVAAAEGRIARPGVRVVSVKRDRGRLGRMAVTTMRVLRAALREDASLYHLHDPELVPAGLVLRALGRKVVYDAHEDLPRQVRSKAWIPGPLRTLVAAACAGLESLARAAMDGVVYANASSAERFSGERCVMVQNFPRRDEFESVRRPAAPGPFQFVYVGAISAIRGVREMVEAMALLPEKSEARIVLVGAFDRPALLEEVSALPGWARVDFRGWLDREALRAVMAEASAGIVLFQPVPHHVDSRPTKLFEYMSAGLPVLASDFPAWRGLVGDAGCGMLVDPGDPAAIAEAIVAMERSPERCAEMGERGRRLVLERYSWEADFEGLLALYRRVLGETERGSVAA